MKPLIIEIHGTGIHNRGAELMAIAIVDRLRAQYPDASFAVPPEFGSFADKARYGFLSTWESAGRFGWARTVLNMFRWGFRKDTISPARPDVVLDASGFAFSDQWGERPAKNLYRKMERFYRKKQLLILLPQALGTFKNPTVANWCRNLFNRAAKVYARDEKSLSLASPLITDGKLRKYPDFTIGISPQQPPADLGLPERFAAIVPNMRMMDKSGNANAYLAFLHHAIRLMKERGANPVFVIHDAQEDRKIVQLLGTESGSLPILTHQDPRVLKGILGKADFVIGSRFHALVSSLSQGIPCIGAGWSHKYPELFQDFNNSDLLVSNMKDLGALEKAIEQLTSNEQRAVISARIQQAALSLKQEVAHMWNEVIAQIDKHHG